MNFRAVGFAKPKFNSPDCIERAKSMQTFFAGIGRNSDICHRFIKFYRYLYSQNILSL